MAEDRAIRVTVLYSPAPREVHEWPVLVPSRSNVFQAIEASDLRSKFPDVDLVNVVVGVWGRKARFEQVLRDRDRVEIYRPLKVDPKLARRERFRKQGARAPGLFARNKSETKPKPSY